MNSAIQENRDAVSSLKTLLGVDSSTNLWTSSELTGIKADVAQAKEDITTLTTTVSSNTDNIATHNSDIATMKEQIEALTGCDATDGISTETINSICTFTSILD